MRKVMLAVALFIIAVPLFSEEAYRLSGKAGNYTVTVTLDKARPVEGENRIHVQIADKASRPVRDARVAVEYFMPSLPGKPPMMDYKTTATPAGDAYETTLDLKMPGEWRAVVSITKGKQTAKSTFPFEVR